jgi:hypothetical protein
MTKSNAPYIVVDREKYLKIAEEEGADAALNALHQEIREWELETFEGKLGYRPELYEEMKKLREFSRELYNIELFGKPGLHPGDGEYNK